MPWTQHFASSAKSVEQANKPKGRPAKGVKANSPAAVKRRKRAFVTDATRAEVKKLVDAGKTGGAIAKAVGVSLPTVQNIKKRWASCRNVRNSSSVRFDGQAGLIL